MARSKARRKRPRGTVEELLSGALRVKVYAGFDPVTKRRHYLRETVPAGPQAHREAEKVQTRLLNQVDEQRNPRTAATVNQLVTRYLDQYFDGEPSTRQQYRAYLKHHIAPFIGEVKVGSLDVDALDSLYAELRRCRDHCTGKRRKDHRTSGKHECDHRCGPHECKPLGATAIRHIHYLLSGAFKRAVRWKWVAVNPVSQAEPPASPPARPKPPSAEEAVQLLHEAWQDPDWGTLLWRAMTTGARRGELCALRWRDVDLAAAVLTLERAIAFDPEQKVWFEKGTKTHQHRRVALDDVSVEILTEHRDRCRARAESLGEALSGDGFVFSLSPDASTWLVPSSVTQRYERMATRLGIEATLHKLRHYSATELISSGVDVRTVAGRLGHGSGGMTTLRVYSAWVSEADQRASAALANRVPERPRQLSQTERAKTNPRNPYERLAARIREQILQGELTKGDELLPLKELAAEHGVSIGTAQRAIALLKEWGMVEVLQGRRTTVTADADPLATEDSDSTPTAEPAPQEPHESPRSAETGPTMLEFQVRHLGELVRTFSAEADPTNPDHLRRLLAAAVRRDGRDNFEIIDYELDVHRPGGEHLTTFVTIAP
ncbi:tyrosine-type recombinase/integrase [Haloactinomyces albus]|uniref:Integrase/DNA-binding transcriptional regulator YhcF (GntR family) n=1 Tax=Haloactinomyces albus TaxID=1352928 RepID=A0AAE3ZD28_9ACTN|nr:tyrosine-type recombinase/integrase [Haloactinomyces albus]MDR7300869.1 integrase/DNA-binding transcriptional regulator YhcF (GntR family) [Haloactinomyces albus]